MSLSQHTAHFYCRETWNLLTVNKHSGEQQRQGWVFFQKAAFDQDVSFTEKSHNNTDKAEKNVQSGIFSSNFFIFSRQKFQDIKKFEPLSYLELLHRNQLEDVLLLTDAEETFAPIRIVKVSSLVHLVVLRESHDF